MRYNDEKRYVGHRDQLLKAKRIVLQDGKANNVSMIDVSNRSGMRFDVNISRGMDIPYLEYCGENFGFVSPCGVVAPEYFDDKELGFLKSFTAGFLTTCGLKMAGAPCEYQGKAYGLHGNISHTPAEEVCCEIVEDEEIPYIKITGKVRDAVVFGDKLVLKREIRCYYRDRKITLHDEVTNEGYKKAHHMIIYHCNIGYPVLAPESEIFIPSNEVKARNSHAQEGIQEWMRAQESDPDYEEMCYYHKLHADEQGYAAAAIFNHEENLGVAIKYNTDTLERMVQWKMMGAGEYVMGLEPCNTTIDGIEDAIENGSMKYLEPGETVCYDLELCVLNSESEFNELKQKFQK